MFVKGKMSRCKKKKKTNVCRTG